ncbi:hypothetical protein U91I_00471 [alpha proteobacterium U9-1i]|nr:hypothetical protein U91I_00471 [alpha proteobacterium U9-1i]
MARIEVTGGHFKPSTASRFVGASMLLVPKAGQHVVRRSVRDLESFKVCDGVWARCFDETGAWTRALSTAAVAGAPGALANLAIPTFFIGQKALITWANALVGATAAATALRSQRLVRFQARFIAGEALEAKASEREVMRRLPQIYRVLASG